MKRLIYFIPISLILLLVGCTSQSKQSDIPQVTATFYPMYAMTKAVAGDEVKVDMLIGAGIEPHDFEPSAKQLVQLEKSDLVIYDSRYLENWLVDVEKSSKQSDKFIEVTKDMSLLEGTEHEHEHDEDDEADHEEASEDVKDPHVWLSPKRAKLIVQTITQSLSKHYPKLKAKFEANSQDYLKKLADLDKAYSELTQAKNKTFITQHAAFSYLAEDYGLTQVPISGLSPEEEPSPAKLASLKQYVTTHHIERIYFEDNASDKLAKTLAKEANVELSVLNPLESLTKEELAKGADYLSVMKENLAHLKLSINDSGDSSSATALKLDAANGVFEDKEVQDRSLSDWDGDWQSVYPYLQAGKLAPVFEAKAKATQDKTVDEYKAYYTKGYQTDIASIEISDDKVIFKKDDGETFEGKYVYDGYKILTYKSGKKGVRYLFSKTEGDDKMPKYIQFSDHIIAPEKAAHFHLYSSDSSQAQLLEETEHWPTYYPAKLSGDEIIKEMLAD